MCFMSRQPAIVENVLPAPEPEPIIKEAKPPEQLTGEMRTLQPQTYQPGFQQAGSSSNRRRLARTGTSIPRRTALTTGVGLASGGGSPAGGINL